MGYGRMKLLVLTNLFPNAEERTRGIFIYQQLKALNRKHDIKVICPVAWHPFKHSIKTHKSEFGGIPVIYVRYFYTPKVLRSLYGLFLTISIINHFRKTEKVRYDKIYAFWAYPDGFAAWALSRLYKIPLIISLRGSDINVLTLYPLLRWQIRYILNKCEHVFAVSRELKEKTVAIGVLYNKITVIPNGVDNSIFYPSSKESARKIINCPLKELVLLYVGGLKDIKGVMILMEAIRIIATAGGSEMTLYLVGEGPLRASIERFAEINNLKSWVKCVGGVRHERIAVWMNAADRFVLPSYHEGCPNVLLEALACNLPVVATNVGAVPDIVADFNAAVLVPPGDPAAMARAIQESFDKRWDLSAFETIKQKYTWDAVVDSVGKYL